MASGQSSTDSVSARSPRGTRASGARRRRLREGRWPLGPHVLRGTRRRGANVSTQRPGRQRCSNVGQRRPGEKPCEQVTTASPTKGGGRTASPTTEMPRGLQASPQGKTQTPWASIGRS